MKDDASPVRGKGGIDFEERRKWGEWGGGEGGGLNEEGTTMFGQLKLAPFICKMCGSN